MLAPRLLLGLAFLLIAAVASAADPDPIQLLRDAANAAHGADSASVEIVVSTTLVRDEKIDDMAESFSYRTAPGGRFEFQTLAEDGTAAPTGYRVAGNGEVTMTALLSRRRHMLEEGADGFAAFVRSPAAMGIGSGLGGLALAFLHPAAADELAASVIESEYVGEEEIDGETLVHARYTVQGDVTSDVWFTAGDVPLIRRVKPNVLDTPGVRDMASRYDEFDYQLAFEFDDWNTEAGLDADQIAVAEPNGSLLMTSLYQAPPRGPHPLLGKEAPAFTLPTAAGDEVNLAEKFGQEVVLLEFWATNCPYCVKAMPELEELEEKYAEKGLGYYAVNVGESPEDVAAFLEKQGLTPTALLDEEAEMATAYEVGPIPLILVVGRDGKIQSANEGFSATAKNQIASNIEATLDGEDLASGQIAEWKAVQDARMAERKRLRSLLDG